MQLLVGAGNERQLFRRWPHQVTKVLVRRQETILDDGRDLDLVIDGAEEIIVTPQVVGELAGAVGRRRRQPEDGRAVEVAMHVGQYPAPVRQQMMAFIEDDEPDAALAQPVQSRQSRGMQRVERLAAQGNGVADGFAIGAQPLVMVIRVAAGQVFDPGAGLV